jgi:hypothetical protein
MALTVFARREQKAPDCFPKQRELSFGFPMTGQVYS